MITGRVHPDYGNPSAPAPPWDRIDEALVEAQLYWLVTVRRDGRPHAVPLCGVWTDGTFAFATGDREQKMRNLETNPLVAVATGPLGASGWAVGKDVIVEGRVVPVDDDAELTALAGAWFEKYGDDWHFEVHAGRFFEVSQAGEGDGARVFRVVPSKVIVFGDEHGQTTYNLRS